MKTPRPELSLHDEKKMMKRAVKSVSIVILNEGKSEAVLV